MKTFFLLPFSPKTHAIVFSVIAVIGFISTAMAIANFDEKGTVASVLGIGFYAVWTVLSARDVWISINNLKTGEKNQ